MKHGNVAEKDLCHDTIYNQVPDGKTKTGKAKVKNTTLIYSSLTDLTKKDEDLATRVRGALNQILSGKA
jgi:hypothetical protein